MSECDVILKKTPARILSDALMVTKKQNVKEINVKF